MKLLFTLGVIYILSSNFVFSQKIRDTTINENIYHIYPYTIFISDIDYLESAKEIPYESELPNIPALSDYMSDGKYISMDRYYIRKYKMPESEYPTKVKSYINCYFTVVNGKKNGTAEFYNEKKKLLAKGVYKDDLKNGEWIYYNKNNKIIVPYINDIKQGKVTLYNHNKIVDIAHYKDNDLNGVYQKFFNNGKIQIYTKYCLRNINEFDELYFDNTYKDYDSIYLEYHSNGKIAKNIRCKNGRNHLEYCVLYKNGDTSIKQVILYKNDTLIRYAYYSYYTNKYFYSENEYNYLLQTDSKLKSYYLFKNGDTSDIEYSLKYYGEDVLNNPESYLLIESSKYRKKYYHVGLNKEFVVEYRNNKPLYEYQFKRIDSQTFRVDFIRWDPKHEYQIICYNSYNSFIDDYLAKDNMINGSDSIEIFYKGLPCTESFIIPDYISVKGTRKYSTKDNFYINRDNFKVQTLSNKEFYKISKKKYYDDSVLIILPEDFNIKKDKIFNEYFKYKYEDNITDLIIINGKIEGPCKVHINREYRNIDKTYTYKNGLKHGPASDYNITEYYKNNLLDGPVIQNLNTNNLVMLNYKQGLKHGLYLENRSESPFAVKIFNFQNDLLHGKSYELSKDGDTLIQASFNNGLIDGKLERKRLDLSNYYNGKNNIYIGSYQKVAIDTTTRIILPVENLNFKKGYYHGIQTYYNKKGILHYTILPDSNQFSKIKLTHQDYKYSWDFIETSISGKYTYYYKDGKIQSEGNIKSDDKVNLWKYYNTDEQLIKTCDYKYSGEFNNNDNLIKKGYLIEYNTDGTVHRKGYILETRNDYDCDLELNIDEESVYYDEIHDVSGYLLMRNGTGEVVIYHNNGEIKCKGRQIDTLRDGLWIFYDKNGNPVEAGNYNKGVKHGKWLKGDLRGLKFIDNLCYADDISAMYIKEKSETNLNIAEILFDNGLVVQTNTTSIYRSDRPRAITKWEHRRNRRGRIEYSHGDNF